MSMIGGPALCPKNAMLAPRQACAAAGTEPQQHACGMPQGSHLLGCKPRHAAHGRQADALKPCVNLYVGCWLLVFPPQTKRSISATQQPNSVSKYELAAAGRSYHVTRTHATGTKVAPMIHPPGPSRIYPEANQAIADYLNELAIEIQRTEEVSQVASASPETTAVIETPPEWGRPDEGNPNQPRRPPEYTPPQVGNKYTQGCGCSAVLQYSWQNQTFSRLTLLHLAQLCLPDIHAMRISYISHLALRFEHLAACTCT